MAEKEHIAQLIESILFVYGEPMTVEKLAKVTERKKEEVRDAIDALRDSLSDRGIVLIEKDGSVQLGTRPEHASAIEKLIKGDFSEDLSKAAVETLATVAYKGPITRADIEYVRGVNSSFTLRNLLMRGLIERVENPKDARAYVYKISFDFLRYLGITKVDELPGFEEFKKSAIEIFEEKPSGEASTPEEHVTE